MYAQLKLPLIRLLFWFITGICLCEWTTGYTLYVWVVLMAILLGVMGILVFALFRRIAYGQRWIPGIMIMAFFLLSGYVMHMTYQPASDPYHLSNRTEPDGYMLARMLSPLQPGKKSMKCTMSVITMNVNGKWHRTTGKLVAYFRNDIMENKFKYGDTLLITASPTPVPPPANPFQFDFKRYLGKQRVYHQVFLTPDRVQLGGRYNRWDLKHFSIQLRDQLSAILQRTDMSDQERAIAHAILLGDKSHLDDETYHAFSASGTIHILCVSGLHVGIIYLILNSLLGVLPQQQWAKRLRAALTILLIWFYALLTGLSPSVLRASVMFSILCIGNSLRRSTNIYNTLATSALLLLLVRPGMVMETGFQLSYLAVIGIVSLQPSLNGLLAFNHWLPSKIWSLMTVSAAAQLFTFPLTIHLFHQFPNYFLLANLLVVPFSGIVIYLGIAVFITYPFPVLWTAVTTGFTWLVRIMNTMVGFVENIPYSTCQDVCLDAIQVILLYGIILPFTSFLHRKKIKTIRIALVFALLLITYGSYLTFQRIHLQQIIVYAVPGSTALAFIHGNNGLALMDEDLYQDEERVQQRMKEHWVHSRIKNLSQQMIGDSLPTDYGWLLATHHADFTFFQMAGRSLIVIGKDPDFKAGTAEKIRVDCVLLRDNARVSIAEISMFLEISCVVADHSNSRWKVASWKKQASAVGIPFHDVAEKGAFHQCW